MSPYKGAAEKQREACKLNMRKIRKEERKQTMSNEQSN